LSKQRDWEQERWNDKRNILKCPTVEREVDMNKESPIPEIYALSGMNLTMRSAKAPPKDQQNVCVQPAHISPYRIFEDP
jgi:hypothetical protein